MEKGKKQTNDEDIPYLSKRILFMFCMLLTVFAIWPLLKSDVRSRLDQWWFYLTILVIFCEYALLVSLINFVTRRLDRGHTLHENFRKRIRLQLIFGWAGPVILTVLFTLFYFILAGIPIEPVVYLERSLSQILLIAFVLNGINLAIYYSWFIHELLKIAEDKKAEVLDNDLVIISSELSEKIEQSEDSNIPFENREARTLAENNPVKPQSEIQEEKNYREHFIIPIGTEEVKILVTDIAFLFREDRDMKLKTNDGSSHVFWQSLDAIEKELDSRILCRVCRTHIISRKAVLRYEELSIGGLLIYLIQQSSVPIKVSREKEASVKKWLDKEPDIR